MNSQLHNPTKVGCKLLNILYVFVPKLLVTSLLLILSSQVVSLPLQSKIQAANFCAAMTP